MPAQGLAWREQEVQPRRSVTCNGAWRDSWVVCYGLVRGLWEQGWHHSLVQIQGCALQLSARDVGNTHHGSVQGMQGCTMAQCR